MIWRSWSSKRGQYWWTDLTRSAVAASLDMRGLTCIVESTMVDTDSALTPRALNVWQLKRPTASLLLPEPGSPVRAVAG